MTEDDLIELVKGLAREDLHRWIAQGWVRPLREGERYVFAEIDCARVRLIHEVRDDLAIDEEGIPVVLSLIDQIYGLRRELRRLMEAVAAQPEEVRKAIAERCGALEAEDDGTG